MNVAQHILVVDDEPDLRVLDALLRVPALTPKALAALKGRRRGPARRCCEKLQGRGWSER